MTSPFFGLDLALRALHAQQNGVDVTNHNVANANTPGFSRQRVDLVETDPFTMAGFNRAPGVGQIGTGVIADSIKRMRDGFLDVQYRQQAGLQSQAQVSRDALEEVQIALNEPSTSGLSSQLSAFFQTWQDLNNDPNDLPVRATVVQGAVSLAQSFNRLSSQLTDVRDGLNSKVQGRVDEVNSITDQVVALNKQIVQVEVAGNDANDFRDQRDALLDRLSQLVQITVTDNADGSNNVLIGSQALVSGVTKQPLQTVAGTGGILSVEYVPSVGPAVAATLGNAELGGLITTRDVNVPNYLAKLDTIASSLITAVNTLHTGGFDRNGTAGQAFFTGTSAATIAVNANLVADNNLVVAASAAGQAGNGDVALQIAQLRDSMNPGPESAFGALIAGLGVDTRAAQGLAENQTTLVDSIDRRRKEISGVSLDEESVNLLRFQRAYQAAARLITAQDEMLDKLINDTGVVGR